MSYKFESMMIILNRINSSLTVTRQGLANDFGITVRSVDRYIDTLRTAGFPIVFDQDRGSYCFEQGYSLHHAEFTAEESLALGLAKSLVSRFGPRTGRVLDGIERKMSVCSFSLPKHVVFSANEMPAAVEEHFRKLNYAIANLSLVEMVYSTAYKGGERSTRVVEPHYLLFLGSQWYVRAFCRERKEPRLFALDRIESLSVLERHFVPRREITPEELKDETGPFVDGEPVHVVARFAKECGPYLKRYRAHPGQKERTLPDGRIELKFRANGTKGVKLWLYRFLPDVEVVAPKELKAEIRSELTEAAERI